MKILLFLIVAFLYYPILAQEEGLKFDSEKIYTQEFIDSLISNPDIKIDLDGFGKMLSSDSKLIGWPHFYSFKSSRAVRNGLSDSVIYYADMTFQTYEETNVKRSIDIRDLILAHINKARVLSIQSNYSNSIINYQKALELSETHPYKWISFARAGLARLHYEIGNDSLALKYFLMATKDSSYMNIPRSSVTTHERLANLYEEMNDYEKAKYYKRFALKTSVEKNYSDDIASLYGGLGEICRKEKKLDSSVYYYKKAVETTRQYGVPDYTGAKENNVFYNSYVDIHEGDINKGIDSLKMLVRAIKKVEEINKDSKDLVDRITMLLGVAYEKQGNSKAYNELFENYIEFSKKYTRHKEKEGIENLEIKYQVKLKDSSIAQLEESKLQQEKLIRQQQIITFGLGGLLLLMFGLGYLFWRQRKLKNRYEKENLEQRLLRSQMNPHFVSNALNTVCALVDKKSDQTIPYVNKLAGLFRLTLTNSREEFIGLDEEITALKNYLELQSNLSNDFDFNIHVDENIDINETIVPPMLIQPFVENAIIHGLSGNEDRGHVEIRINIDTFEKLLQCNISDNGVGYDNTSVELKKHKSVSGDIVRERLAILKKKFRVNTRFNITQNKKDGTRVNLYIPYLVD